MAMIFMKVYSIIDRAVEEGVAYGIRRAHKYHDNPSDDVLQEEIERGVMHALSEVIDFDKYQIQEPEIK